MRSLFDSAHLENRRAGLESYLQSICNIDTFKTIVLAMFLDKLMEAHHTAATR